MARIRSIHPGIWTDEDFAAVSMAARILYLGLLTEADDHGLFEWKPVGLKMRIFPADNVNVDALLAELMKVNKVDVVDKSDFKLGAIRNFCRFQRPKKPSYKHVLPEEYRTYVGLSDSSSEPVGNQFHTGAEISPQMEEGGGRREKERKQDAADAAPTSDLLSSVVPSPPAHSAKSYAFESGIIRLEQKHFDQWKRAYPHLSLEAELISLTKWAGEQGPENWFFAVSGALTKKNRELGLRIEQNKSDGLTNDEKYFGKGRLPGVL